MADAVDRLREEGISAVGRRCDTAEWADVEALRDLALEQGTLDIWVNNAGGAGVYEPTASTPVADFERVVRTNILGTFHGSRAALPVFLAQGHGDLVNVYGHGDRGPVPLQNAYAASKRWARQFTETLRAETKGTGVQVHGGADSAASSSASTTCPGRGSAPSTTHPTRTGQTAATRGGEGGDARGAHRGGGGGGGSWGVGHAGEEGWTGGRGGGRGGVLLLGGGGGGREIRPGGPRVQRGHQPDLNWENPAVRDEVVDICRWWFDRGIDGFRMDVINFISKPTDLPDGHELIGDLLQVAGVEHYFYGPRLHEYLRELRSRAFEVPGEVPKVMVGETPGIGVETGRLLTGADRGELDLVFSFDHLESGGHTRFDDYRYDLEWYKRYLVDYQSRIGSNDWLTLFFENHDNPRMISKVNPDPGHRVALGKLMGTLLLTMRGTPFLYQGQELAAVNQPFTGIHDLRDVEALRRYQTLVEGGATEEEAWEKVLTSTRDHGRVPLRWDATPGGGFTTGTPWLSGGADPGFSVAEQAADPDSVLRHYRRLITLRRGHRALRLGEIEFDEPERAGYFGWFRSNETERFLVQLNLTDQPLSVPEPVEGATLRVGSHGAEVAGTLAPYESRVYRVFPST